MRLQLALLGGFRAFLEPGDRPVVLPTRKAQALLAYLASPPGRVHPRDKLASLLWGDTREREARTSLRQALYAIRRAMEPVDTLVLRVTGETVRLEQNALTVDVVAFEEALAKATPDTLAAAADLYQGELLDGLAVSAPGFDEWLLAERERVHELAVDGLARLLTARRAAGDLEAAIQTALRLLALEPLQEAVHRSLMRLYLQSGRRATALRQYQRCASVLERELGVEPEVETRQLYEECLRARPGRSAEPIRIEEDLLATRLPPPARETRLVGREADYRPLRDALAEAWHGRGQVVILLGEAGVGKTRLMEELSGEAQDRGSRVLVGRCYEMEQILAFRPWIDAIRAGRLVDEIPARLRPEWRSELARLFAELGEPDRPHGIASKDDVRLFDAVAALVGQAATRQPLLLVLEDLHWADEMSVRLLAFVAHRIAGWRAVIVGTAREEEVAMAPVLHRFLQEADPAARIVRRGLLPLSRPETLSLVQEIARPGPAGLDVTRLGARIWTISEGNPFVIVETMRALLQGKASDLGDDVRLPQRVREVISNRLARLGERARELVATAAVVGREFEFELVQKAARLDPRAGAEAMEELVRRRVLREIDDRFEFTHDRIREIAVRDLLPARRTMLHAQVASALEELHADDLTPHYAALAVHSREAHRWEKATMYFRQAGAQAAARSAYREAVLCFEQALDALPHLPATRETKEQAIDLRLALRMALTPYDFERILTLLREAETLAEALDDHGRLARISTSLSVVLRDKGIYDEAIAAAQRALRLTTASRDVALHARTNFVLGIAYQAQGDYRRAMDCLGQAATFFDGPREFEFVGAAILPSVGSRAELAACHAELGMFREGRRVAENGLRIAEAAGHSASLMVACCGVGLLPLRQGDPAGALPLLERAVGLCRDIDLPVHFPWMAAALGAAYILAGRIADAVALLTEAIGQSTPGMEVHRTACYLSLGEAQLQANRPEESRVLTERALARARAQGERGMEAYALPLLGEIEAARDPSGTEQTAGYYHLALALADELGMRPLIAHCHLGLGKLYRRTGKREQAQEHLTTATTMYREMGMTYWLERATAELSVG